MTKLNIKNIVEFFDHKDALDGKHASSISGLLGEELAAGLLNHYLENDNCQVEILPEKPTEGKRKGKWLDRWIKVNKNNSTTYYQTEIKNWCSHSLGGQAIPLNSTDEELIRYAHNRFYEQWDSQQQKFNDEKVAKVLKVMKTPSMANLTSDKIQPLVCYWFPILSNSQKEVTPIFTIACSGSFETLTFFSMSVYLRQLLRRKIETLEVPMPLFEERKNKLEKMFQNV